MFSIISEKSEILKYADEIVRLETACFDDRWSEEIITDSLKNELYFCAVSLYNDGVSNKLSGYCIGTVICGECEIQRICVDDRFRREGIGYSLMNFVVDNIKADLFLLEVRESNLPAISLYKKSKFEPYYVRKNYYGPGENAVLMRRQ